MNITSNWDRALSARYAARLRDAFEGGTAEIVEEYPAVTGDKRNALRIPIPEDAVSESLAYWRGVDGGPQSVEQLIELMRERLSLDEADIVIVRGIASAGAMN